MTFAWLTVSSSAFSKLHTVSSPVHLHKHLRRDDIDAEDVLQAQQEGYCRWSCQKGVISHHERTLDILKD